MSIDVSTKSVDWNLVKKLQECRTKGEVGTFMDLNGIAEFKEKTRYLKAAMGETESYYSEGHGGLSKKAIYLDDEAMFLNGSWRYFSP